MRNEDDNGGSPPARRRPSRWHAPIWWANGLAVIALLLSYLSIRISPTTFWPLALFGIAYPYILVANLLCIGWWLLFRRKRVLPSLLAILLGWSHVGEYVQFFGNDRAPADAPRPFKVMSYNVRLFDLYNWTHNKETHDRIMALLRQEHPHILCMQEYLKVPKGDPLGSREQLLGEFGYTASAEAYTARTKYDQSFGIAIFSTMPIIAKGTIHFPDDLNNLCLWADVVVGADTARIYTAHLASLRFGDQDYRFMREIEQGGGRDSLRSAGPRIVGRLRDAFIRRAAEVAKITAHMADCPYPVVYCGDLNDTPMSYSYHELREAGLEDAFVESGTGFGHTYIGAFPSFRIDHILHAPRVTSWAFRTVPNALSDHHPVTAWMAITPRR